MCNLRRPAVCAISSAMGSLSAFKEIWRKEVLKMFVCGYTKTVMGSEMEIKTSLLLHCVPPKSPNTTHEPHLPLIRTQATFFANWEKYLLCPFVVLGRKKSYYFSRSPAGLEAPHLTRQYKLPKKSPT